MIHEILKPGKANAMTATTIAAMLHYPVRKVSERVMKERRQGVPICSCQDGYYLAANDEELKDMCHSLWHRAGEIFKTRRALLKHLPQDQNKKKK